MTNSREIPSWLKFIGAILAVVVSAGMVYAGAARGIRGIGDEHIRDWWAAEGSVAADRMMDAKIERHRVESEANIQAQLAAIEKDLAALRTLAEQNHETANKLLDALLEDRKK